MATRLRLQYSAMRPVTLAMLVATRAVVHARCSCGDHCKNIEIPAWSAMTWHIGSSCSGGAGLSNIDVSSTDDSGFTVTTSKHFPDREYLVRLSTVSTDSDGNKGIHPFTCWHTGRHMRNITPQGDLFVTIKCKNWFMPCPLLYRIEFMCESMSVWEAAASLAKGVALDANHLAGKKYVPAERDEV